MHKTITPVVSVILLIMLTIVASAGAYFFITSEVNNLQSSGAIESSPYLDNSRLNLVSITGSQALVRTEGSSPVTEVVVLINGEALNYTLDSPIQPGEIREINYTNRIVGEDLEIKVIYNKGKTEKDISPAIKNTETSGFVESLCGDNICSPSRGESVINCFSDCGIKKFMYQHEDYNGVDDSIVAIESIIKNDSIFFGNRTIVYAPGGELYDGKPIFFNINALNLFNMNNQVKYIVYDGSGYQVLNLTHESWQSHEVNGEASGNNAHVVFTNCTIGYNYGCDLVYTNYTIGREFEDFEKITNLGIGEENFTDAFLFSLSNNENHMIAFWFLEGLANYTIFNNGWSETLTLFNDSGVSSISSVSINNNGETIVIYKNNSINEAIFFNSTGSEKLDNDFFDDSGTVLSQTIDDSFILLYTVGSSPPYNTLNSTIINNREYSNFASITKPNIVALMMFYKITYGQLMTTFLNSSGYHTSFLYNFYNNSWSTEIPTALSGVGLSYCQEYERYSGECAAETWCSDGVDNDEDGYYDLDDSDC
jgi:hypothetical protein